jgi:hypothetical protein
MRKPAAVFMLIALICALPARAVCAEVPMKLDAFDLASFTANEFGTFVKVFGEMRGPLRAAILKDRKTDFENVDPLKYVEKVKDKRDVRDALSNAGLTWGGFTKLWGNVMLAYFSLQPSATKAALVRQIADYGLSMNVEGLPDDLKPLIAQVLKTEAGSTLAAAALEYALEIPPQNIAIAKEHQRDLDRMFYTKYWRDEIR